MIEIDNKSVSRKEFITVDFFYKQAKNIGKLKLLSENADMNKKISDHNH